MAPDRSQYAGTYAAPDRPKKKTKQPRISRLSRGIRRNSHPDVSQSSGHGALQALRTRCAESAAVSDLEVNPNDADVHNPGG